MNEEIKIPIAKIVPEKFENHGDIRIDNYHWMRLSDEQKNAETKDEQTQEVFAYLNNENAYFKGNTKHTQNFQKTLFEEMKSRIKEDDNSVPYFKNGYFYIVRFEKGKQYPIYTRKKETLNAKEEVLLDVNKLAENFEYFQVGGISISPDNQKMIYSVDTVSRRQYTLYIKDLHTQNLYKDTIENTTGEAVWANDNQTLFYVKKNEKTLRSEFIYKHILGENSQNDILIYQEKDEAFGTCISKSKSQKYLLIASYSTLSTEYQILESDNPHGDFRLFQKREKDLEYSIAHYENHFYILTNKDKAFNFKMMKTAVNQTQKEFWTEVLPHRENVLLEDFTLFKNYLVLEERSNGLNKIRVKKWDETEDYYLPFSEETYTAGVGMNPEFETDELRYAYNSMTTPSSVVQFNMQTQTQKVLKEQEVLGGVFQKENYESKRIWARARDGEKIAISLVHHQNTILNENTPFLLYAYGSYGHTVDASFSSLRLSLLDRGFVFGIAHIRGSEYLGRNWYEKGKLKFKKNTFYDFIDCSKFLINEKITAPENLYAMGGSAGGLLMGVVMNEAPELYKGVVAMVPFVDVINTMLDETIPLTTGEYDEWGNPQQKDFYEYMKSYSPYDNVKKQAYPNILITTGLQDSQVQYWEPAKWIAKLRTHHTGSQKLFLNTDMKTGHGGASGRFDALQEVAKEYAFILDLAGKIKY